MGTHPRSLCDAAGIGVRLAFFFTRRSLSWLDRTCTIAAAVVEVRGEEWR